MNASKRKRGRPTVYTPAIADEICTRLAAGDSLKSICRDAHMPDAHRVREWALDDREGFSPRYARARELGYEAMAEEILEISDGDYFGPDGYVDNAAVQQARLKSDNRKWLLSKVLPKKFGDKVTQKIIGEDGGALITRIELVPVAPRPRPEGLPAPNDGEKATVTPLRALPSR